VASNDGVERVAVHTFGIPTLKGFSAIASNESNVRFDPTTYTRSVANEPSKQRKLGNVKPLVIARAMNWLV
jgi:hypothetical protein